MIIESSYGHLEINIPDLQRLLDMWSIVLTLFNSKMGKWHDCSS